MDGEEAVADAERAPHAGSDASEPGPIRPEIGPIGDFGAARGRLGRHDPVLLAWVFVVGTAAASALALDYATLHAGARVLFFASLVELAWAIPEEQAESRDGEQFVFVGVSLVAICLGLLFEGLFALASLDLGAAQLVALTGVISRLYVNYLYDDSFRAALSDPDPVTHPFITVGALTTFGLGLTVRLLAVATGGLVPSPDSTLAFFPLVAVGATAGLVAHAFDVTVIRRVKRDLDLATGDVPEESP